MAISKNRIDDFLAGSRVMLNNSLAIPEIKSELANYGFDEAKLLTGRALYEAVAALQAAQKKEFGEQVAATAELNTLWDEVDKMYMKTLKVARVAFKDNPEIGRALILYGDRKASFSGRMEQVRIFYTNFIEHPNLAAPMTQFGYTPDKIQIEFNSYTKLANQGAQQQKEIGEAQAATTARDKKLDELASYISDLRAVARVALDNDPQQLEKLGILARSEGGAPRKNQEPPTNET